MLYPVLGVVLHTLGGVVAAAVLVLGFAFLIFVGDANARERSLVSEGFDQVAVLVVYLSWFGPLWWLGANKLVIMIACGATIVLCLIYVASYRAASGRQSAPLRP